MEQKRDGLWLLVVGAMLAIMALLVGAVSTEAVRRQHGIAPNGGIVTIRDGESIKLPGHARSKYVITEIGADGDMTPVLASWTVEVKR